MTQKKPKLEYSHHVSNIKTFDSRDESKVAEVIRDQVPS